MKRERTETTTPGGDAKISLRQAAELNGYGASYQALFRAARYGTIARNGERVHLEHHRLGGRLYVTLADIEAYAHRLAEADREHFARVVSPALLTDRRPRVRASSIRERQVAAAEAELRRFGI